MESLGLVNCFAAGGLVYAFEKATLASKLILFLLLLASSLSWTVIFVKFGQLRFARRQTQRFLERLRPGSWYVPYANRERFPGSPEHAVYAVAFQELLHQAHFPSVVGGPPPEKLLPDILVKPPAVKAVQGAIERELGIQGLFLEEQMVLLATAASGAPFLGLLGTVWGVMDAFSDIAIVGKASLAAMAPGVSGSLICTVTGLLVAIPALFAYNFLIATIRSHTIRMENFAAELQSELERSFLEPDS
ncbi:MotA/TolQ/ExbB proton channel family protein [Methylacidimicrobium tartarophylax]|uniref:Biopolymer transport protein ExbB n=1 Tax=Methylacidimicrobium tartarophylax TaxID=1041768 RepID=A0A5E6MQP1_9BACT|nr:MotA/TolQ/ExbB proton channel family protein [Methylacidimicrobium tartarophylax]VVM08006.1 Biopolymer transport protein ExbB [Methylacidimicrobium tartarophylax]